MAHGIYAAAASEHAFAHHYVCPLRNVWRVDCTDEDCLQLARAVVVIDAHLKRGHKVVVQCTHGRPRTAMAIYVVMCFNVETHADAVSMMRTMSRAMHTQCLSANTSTVASPTLLGALLYKRAQM